MINPIIQCPDLTAVIPAYRCARYLRAAVQSVLLCNVARIIIAEDRGDDETLLLARELRDQHPGRIALLEGECNLGVSANCNRAFDQVKTPLIMKVDADDVVIPTWVHAAYQFMTSHREVSILSGTGTMIGPDEFLNITESDLPCVAAPAIGAFSGVEACELVLQWDPNPISSGALYRTAAMRAVGGFATGRAWAEDREVWFRLARVFPVAFGDAPSALYRRHGESATTRLRANGYAALMDWSMMTEAERLWPEPELRPYFAHCYYQIARECRWAAEKAMEARDFKCGMRLSLVCLRSLSHAAALSLPVFGWGRQQDSIDLPAPPEPQGHELTDYRSARQ